MIRFIKIALIIFVALPLFVAASPVGSSISIGITRVVPFDLKGEDAMMEGERSPLGFSKGVSTGQNVNFDRYRSFSKSIAVGGQVGFSTISEERSGTTTIANIYKVTPQVKPFYQVTQSLAVSGIAGAGLSVVSHTRLTRDDRYASQDLHMNMRLGSGIQYKNIELRLESNGLLLNDYKTFRWTEFNVGYTF
ncbi:MAG: hypothetical protein OCC49_10755 [Fibrobacterales bacterium]